MTYYPTTDPESNVLIGDGTAVTADGVSADNVLIGTNIVPDLENDSENVMLGSELLSTAVSNNDYLQHLVLIGYAIDSSTMESGLGPAVVIGRAHDFASGTVVLGANNNTLRDAIAIGSYVGAGNYVIALGERIDAAGSYSIALGQDLTVEGQYNVAIGQWAQTYEDYSIAIGYSSYSEGGYAVGRGSAAGQDGVAVGTDSMAGLNSVAIGHTATVYGSSDRSISIGRDSLVKGDNSLALGTGISVKGDYSMALGYGASVEGNNSLAVGPAAYVNTDNTAVFVYDTTTFSGDLETEGITASGSISTQGDFQAEAGVFSSFYVLNDDATSFNRAIYFMSDTTPRWILQMSGNDELGGNSGSNLELTYHSDDGNEAGTALRLYRDGGTVEFHTHVHMMDDLELDGNIDADGAVVAQGTVSSGTGLAGPGVQTGNVAIDAPSEAFRLTEYRTNGSNRWAVGVSDEAESGSNAGSTFVIQAYGDDGQFQANLLEANRVDGTTQFNFPVLLSGDPTVPTQAATKAYVDANSGGSRSISVISGNTTAGSTAKTDYVYVCSAGLTLTLPAAAGNTNHYTVKRSGTGSVTVATTGGATIDGTGSFAIDTQWMSVDLVSDGTNWVVI